MKPSYGARNPQKKVACTKPSYGARSHHMKAECAWSPHMEHETITRKLHARNPHMEHEVIIWKQHAHEALIWSTKPSQESCMHETLIRSTNLHIFARHSSATSIHEYSHVVCSYSLCSATGEAWCSTHRMTLLSSALCLAASRQPAGQSVDRVVMFAVYIRGASIICFNLRWGWRASTEYICIARHAYISHGMHIYHMACICIAVSTLIFFTYCFHVDLFYLVFSFWYFLLSVFTLIFFTYCFHVDLFYLVFSFWYLLRSVFTLLFFT